MLPNFLIIGAPRAGTTWLARKLRQHPDVFMPRTKELHFFDKNYDRGLGYYEEFFEGWRGESAVGEATPAYLAGVRTQNDIPRLINRHMPGAKLIASLRNPVERAYSAHWKGVAASPGEADLAFEERIRQSPRFLDTGLYYDHLLRYYALFPRDQLLVLLFDDLESDQAGFLRDTFSFLRVDSGFIPRAVEERVNASSSKGALGRSRLLWYLHRGLNRVGADKLAGSIERKNRVDLPPMKAETRRWLVEFYREKNLQLQDLIGRDLSHWNQIT